MGKYKSNSIIFLIDDQINKINHRKTKQTNKTKQKQSHAIIQNLKNDNPVRYLQMEEAQSSPLLLFFFFLF